VKTFYYLGANDQNKSGVSWKVWQIHRAGRVVEVQWGAAEVRNRKVVPLWLHSLRWQHATVNGAKAVQDVRIQQKLRNGYKELPTGGLPKY